jgi:hypothetical protein
MSGERLWSLHGGPIDRLSASIARWASVTLLGLLGASAVVMAARRLAGALPRPLEPVPMLAAAATVAIAVFAIRLGWPIRSAAGFASRSALVAMIGASLAAVAFGAAISASGTHVGAVFSFWGLLGLEEAWAWRQILRRSAGVVPPRAWRFWRRDRRELSAPDRVQASTVLPAHRVAKDSGAWPADEVVQQLVRGRGADGSDTLSGFARLVFAPGQRSGSVHVAFCPPFARTPELSVEQIDGPEARVRTAQLLPYGVRLDLKLPLEAQQYTSALLQFTARSDEDQAESG